MDIASDMENDAREGMQPHRASSEHIADSPPAKPQTDGMEIAEPQELDSSPQDGLRNAVLSVPGLSGQQISSLFAAAIATDVTLKQGNSQELAEGEFNRKTLVQGTASLAGNETGNSGESGRLGRRLLREGDGPDNPTTEQKIHWGYKRPRTTRSQNEGRPSGEGEASSEEDTGGLNQLAERERIASGSYGGEVVEEIVVSASPTRDELKAQVLGLQQQVKDERAQRILAQQQLARLHEKHKVQTVEFNDLKDKVFTMRTKSEELFKSLAAQHEQQNSKYSELRRWESSLIAREEQVQKAQDSLSVLLGGQRVPARDPVQHSVKASGTAPVAAVPKGEVELLHKLALALGQQQDSERKDPMRATPGMGSNSLPVLLAQGRNANGLHSEGSLTLGDITTDSQSTDPFVTAQLYKLLQGQDHGTNSLNSNESLRALARHLSNPPPAADKDTTAVAPENDGRSRSISFPQPAWLQPERPAQQRELSHISRELLPLLSNSSLRETLSHELQQRNDMDRSFSDPGVRRDLPRDLSTADVAALQAILRGSAEALQREKSDRLSRDDRPLGKLDSLSQLESLAAVLNAERDGGITASTSGLSRHFSDLPPSVQRLVEESGVALPSSLLALQMKHDSPKGYGAAGLSRAARNLSDIAGFGRPELSPRTMQRHHAQSKGEQGVE